MLRVLMLAALPQEYAYFKMITSRWLPLCSEPFKTFSCSLPEKEIILIETGMGGDFAADALSSALIKRARPDLLIFLGFAGGLHPDLSAGEVCVVHNTMFDTADALGRRSVTLHMSNELSEFLDSKGVRPVTALTVSAPPDKPALSKVIQGGFGVVDMETARVAGIACRERIPFLCFRAISDSLRDELGFDLAEITGRGGNVEILKVLKTIIRRPPVVMAFYRSWKRSNRAGKNLGRVLADLLNLPATALFRISGEIGIKCD